MTIHRLSNGMTVYSSPDAVDGSGRVAAAIAVRVGSRHDPPGAPGTAHLVEHMMFRGTDEIGTVDWAAERPHLERVHALSERLARASSQLERADAVARLVQARDAAARYAIPGELDRLYTALGVIGVDGTTTRDGTIFSADVPVGALEPWARVEAERLRDPRFRGLYTELVAARAELAAAMGRPTWHVERALVEGLFAGHPRGSAPVGGEASFLETPSLPDLVEFQRGHYRPDRTALVMAGQLDPARVLPVLERAFGSWSPSAAAAPDGPTEPPVAKGDRGRLVRDVWVPGTASVAVGWGIAGARRSIGSDPSGRAALAVACGLLRGPDGLIARHRGTDQGVGCRIDRWADGGVVQIWALLRAGETHAAAEATLGRAVEDLRTGRVRKIEIDGVVSARDVRRQEQAERRADRAARLVRAFVHHEAWDDALTQQAAESRVTRAQVMDAAARVLGPHRVVVRRRVGPAPVAAVDGPRLPPPPPAAPGASAFARRILEMPRPASDPQWLVDGSDFVRIQGRPGPVVAVRNRRNDLYSLSYHFDRGYRAEPLLCHAFDALVRAGVGGNSARWRRTRLRELGATVTLRCNAKESSVTIAGLARHMADAVDLVDRWLRTSTLDDAAVHALWRDTRARRRQHLADDRILGVALRDYAFFGDDSAWLAQPPNAMLAQVKAATVVATAAAVLDHAHRVLYFGPASVDEILELVSSHGARPIPEPAPRRFRRVPRPTAYVLAHPVSSADLSIAWPYGSLPAVDVVLASLWTQVLDGDADSFMTRAFRERSGLAYAARARLDPGVRAADEAALRALVRTVDPGAALRLLLEELPRPPAPAELARARDGLVARIHGAFVDPRDVARQVLAWELRGMGEDPRPGWIERMGALPSGELRAFVEAATQAAPVIALLADPKAVDWPALAGGVDLVEVQVEALFSYGSFSPRQPTGSDQTLRAELVANPTQRPFLELTDPLAGQRVLFSNLAQGPRLSIVQTESLAEDVGFHRAQVVQ